MSIIYKGSKVSNVSTLNLGGGGSYNDTELRNRITDLETNKADKTELANKQDKLVNSTQTINIKDGFVSEVQDNDLSIPNKVYVDGVVAELSSSFVSHKNDTTKHITNDERNAWNNKSDFDGNYNNLINKPTIPTTLSQLTTDASNRTVTDEEKTYWNGKSNFSGSYNDLINKPTIPSSTNQLENNSGFITKEANNLSNYYNKTEVNELHAKLPKFAIKVVNVLPTTDISRETIYLLKTSDTTGNSYSEYIYWVDPKAPSEEEGQWELLASQNIDLSNYLKTSDLNSAINTALSQAQASGNFKGEKGDKGDKGDAYTLTSTDKQTIVNAVISALPKYSGEVV
jgi:hypothetical protein